MKRELCNYVSLSKVSRYVFWVTLLVIDSLDQKGSGNVNLCLSLIQPTQHKCTPRKNQENISKGTGVVRSWQMSGDHPNNNITENGQNTEKSPEDLRRLAVTQTPVKDQNSSRKYSFNIKNSYISSNSVLHKYAD